MQRRQPAEAADAEMATEAAEAEDAAEATEEEMATEAAKAEDAAVAGDAEGGGATGAQIGAQGKIFDPGILLLS